MRSKVKTLIAAATGLAMTATFLTGCPSTDEVGSEALTVVIGTHAQSEDDPNWVDEITGEAAMNPDNIRAAETALQIVEEKLNAKITWKQYSSDLQQLLLQTVLAGDPYCDLAVIWNGIQGNILAQNILQPLDQYVDDVFLGEDDVDKKWILLPKSFGNYYLMNRDLLFVNTWPLCYNINYIEAVPALRENGKTVYPADLYKSGEWTWNKFEDYLSKIQAYYNGRKGPVNSSNDILAFNTAYTYTALMALHSIGESVYDGSNIGVDSENAKQAADWLDKMMNKGLISCTTASSTSTNAGWTSHGDRFNDGETVFTNIARWRMDDAGAALASRGESMGIITFPRPDSLPADSPKYQQLNPVADSVGLMKGISTERSKRVLEAYATYKAEYYKALAHVDSIAEYMDEQANSEALAFGVDIFHPEVGDVNKEIFSYLGSIPNNEFAESFGLQGTWAADILGASIFGVNGTPKYSIAIEANKSKIYNRLDDISKALKKGEVVDDVVPTVNKANNESLVFARGTNPDKIDWTQCFNASDGVDGNYELRKKNGKIQLRKFVEDDAVDDDGNPVPKEKWKNDMIQIDASGVDFETSGKYTDGIVVKLKDYAGNETEKKFEAYVYDKDNTVPPTLTLKEEIPSLDRNTDTSSVDWKGKFVEEALDVNGVDIRDNVSADVTSLDVTEPGVYPVEIYVVDFAGNRTGATIEVEIK